MVGGHQKREIKFGELLGLTNDDVKQMKVRFNDNYNGEGAVEVYKRNHDEVNNRGFLWRARKKMFRVGNIGISLLHVRDDIWLLTTVKRITKDLDVINGVCFDAVEVERFRPYFNRLFIQFHRTRKEETQCVFLSSVIDRLVVHSIEPDEFDGDEFPGYDRVRLSYWQLESIIRLHKKDWVNALSAQKGVYLITDCNTGKLYVGSATSERGMLLARWANYIRNGHGGDVELKRLIEEKNIEYVKQYFQFSLLENYNARVEDKVIRDRESWWKEALQSRAFGYNGN